MRATGSDLDYLAARVHARRSRLADGERLDELCEVRSLDELMAVSYPDGRYYPVAAYQRRLIRDLAAELLDFSRHLAGAEASVVRWMVGRFQLENLKVILRAFTTGKSSEIPTIHLVELADELDFGAQDLVEAKSIEQLIALLPEGELRDSLREAVEVYGEGIRPFLLEAMLDRRYLAELIRRIDRLSGEDGKLSKALAQQEADIFHLMLIVRGRFHYGLDAKLLQPLHVSGTNISGAMFGKMLNRMNLAAIGNWATGRIIEVLPAARQYGEDQLAGELEALAWTRFLRLANRAFRRSHLGVATIIGYVGIRRIEVANLITLSEGVRLGLSAAAIRARLIPRKEVLANV